MTRDTDGADSGAVQAFRLATTRHRALRLTRLEVESVNVVDAVAARTWVHAPRLSDRHTEYAVAGATVSQDTVTAPPVAQTARTVPTACIVIARPDPVPDHAPDQPAAAGGAGAVRTSRAAAISPVAPAYGLETLMVGED